MFKLLYVRLENFALFCLDFMCVCVNWRIYIKEHAELFGLLSFTKPISYTPDGRLVDDATAYTPFLCIIMSNCYSDGNCYR